VFAGAGGGRADAARGEGYGPNAARGRQGGGQREAGCNRQKRAAARRKEEVWRQKL